MAAPASRTATAACARSPPTRVGQRTTDLVAPRSVDRRAPARRPGADAARPGRRHRSHLVGRRAPEPVAARRRTRSARRRRPHRRQHRRCSRCSPAGSASCSTGCRRACGTSPIRPRLDLARSASFAAFVGDTFARRAAPDDQRRPALRDASTGSAASHDATIGWQQPAAARRLPLVDDQFLAARRVRPVRPLRPPAAARAISAYGDPTAPTANVYRWTLPRRPPAPPQRAASARSCSVSGPAPAAIARLLDDRSGAQAAVHGRSWCSASRRARSRPRSCASPRSAGASSNLVGVVRRRRAGVDLHARSPCPTWASTWSASGDDQILLFYNRSPATFGADRYLLTNPSDHDGSFVGADMIGTVRSAALLLPRGRLTAGRSEGLAANRGFGPLENDAAAARRGVRQPERARPRAGPRLHRARLHDQDGDRATSFRATSTFGLIGRYQDGQHFARLVVMHGLNQGAEAVRAFRNGRTRFTFSMTVDARLQKGFTVGGRTADRDRRRLQPVQPGPARSRRSPSAAPRRG